MITLRTASYSHNDYFALEEVTEQVLLRLGDTPECQNTENCNECRYKRVCYDIDSLHTFAMKKVGETK